MKLIIKPINFTDDVNGGPDGEKSGNGDGIENSDLATAAVFLLIDEKSIDNKNEPNDFSETDVNDSLFEICQRQILEYFNDNIGEKIGLYRGQTGDEV